MKSFVVDKVKNTHLREMFTSCPQCRAGHTACTPPVFADTTHPEMALFFPGYVGTTKER